MNLSLSFIRLRQRSCLETRIHAHDADAFALWLFRNKATPCWLKRGTIGAAAHPQSELSSLGAVRTLMVSGVHRAHG